jgi:hypothetical protein
MLVTLYARFSVTRMRVLLSCLAVVATVMAGAAGTKW